MNWTEFNSLFEQKHKLRCTEIFHSEKAEVHETPNNEDLMKIFAFSLYEAYDSFVKQNRKDFNDQTSNFVIDFDQCVVGQEHSGFAKFWVESSHPVLFNKKTGPLGAIPISAIAFELKWKKENSTANSKSSLKHSFIKIELTGHIHPPNWGGRNTINYSPIGKISYTGTNRILNEKLELTEDRLKIFLIQGFGKYFYKGLSYFFL